MNGQGALAGLILGIGLHLLVTGYGPLFARRYIARVEAAWSPPPIARPVWERWLPARHSTSIAARQARAGWPQDPGAHLLLVLRWCVGGLAVGTGLIALLTASGRVRNPVAALPLLVIAVATGYLLADRRLDVAARRRRQRAALELPSLIETMAISVGAGASLPAACEFAAGAEGVLAGEFTALLEELREGRSLDLSLAALGDRIPVPTVVRFTDALRIALDRGTPVVDVLHAQALDARHETRRLLMERAGKREVAMLLPVVFLVLPSVVVIALYPGFRELASMV